MTCFLDTHISYDPRHPEAINPALEFMSWVARPQHTAKEQGDRDRLTSHAIAAAFKTLEKQMPSALGRVKLENISPALGKVIHIIQRRRLPAALMVLRRWVEQDQFDFSRLGLAVGSRRDVMDSLALAAGHLRRLGQAGKHESIPEIPCSPHDIGWEVWVESRPALAMTLALMTTASEFFQAHQTNDHHRALTSMLYDASWVTNAVYNARALALHLDQTLDPPELLVPRRRLVRTIAHRRLLITGGKLNTFRDYIGVADAPEVARIALSPGQAKSA